MRDALLVIDVVNDFDHEHGEALLASFRTAQPHLLAALHRARAAEVPVVYVNDDPGAWNGDAPGRVRRAIEHGRGGELLAAVAPKPGDAFLFKPRYSAFDHTPLDLVLEEQRVERVLLAGAATERCVVQTAIDAKEHGLKVSILADACASIDARMARLALEYAERIVGARIERAG